MSKPNQRGHLLSQNLQQSQLHPSQRKLWVLQRMMNTYSYLSQRDGVLLIQCLNWSLPLESIVRYNVCAHWYLLFFTSLLSNARAYQVFDVLDKKALENTAVLKQYLDMMGQEVKHLLKVLCKSTDRTIDLTASLHHALDVIQEVVYRLLKLYLGSSK